MAHRIPNQERRLSKDARKRMAESGSRNLAAWRKQCEKAQPDIAGDATGFRDRLRASLGHDPSAVEDALLLLAESSYLAISLAVIKLRRTRRLRRLEAAFDRLARLQSSLLRTLRVLQTGQSKPELAWEQELEAITAEIAAKQARTETNDAETPA